MWNTILLAKSLTLGSVLTNSCWNALVNFLDSDGVSLANESTLSV